jgi:hypothetical protein
MTTSLSPSTEFDAVVETTFVFSVSVTVMFCGSPWARTELAQITASKTTTRTATIPAFFISGYLLAPQRGFLYFYHFARYSIQNDKFRCQSAVAHLPVFL